MKQVWVDSLVAITCDQLNSSPNPSIRLVRSWPSSVRPSPTFWPAPVTAVRMRVTAWDTRPTINRWSHQQRLPAAITGPAIASSSSGPSSPNLFKCTSSPGTTSLFAVTFAITLVHLELQLWRDLFPFSFGSVPLSCHDYHIRHVRKCPARRRSGMAFHSTSRPQPVLSADSSHSRVNNIRHNHLFWFHFHSRTVSRSCVESSSNFHSRSIFPRFYFCREDRAMELTLFTPKKKLFASLLDMCSPFTPIDCDWGKIAKMATFFILQVPLWNANGSCRPRQNGLS